MQKYRGTAAEDLGVAAWWVRMERDGDLPVLFCQSHQTLGALYGLIREPNGMIYEADSRGIWFAMWFEQVMGTVFAGAWCAREKRHTRAGLFAFVEAYYQALAVTPTVMGVTKQERLLAPHRRLGYTVLAEVPGLWDGERAWLVMLTREGFAPVLARYQAAMQRAGAYVGAEETVHG